MRRLMFVLAAIVGLATSRSALAQTYVDVVHLKDGSVIRGTIIEQVPGESLKIQTADGSVFVYQIDAVEKMVKEEKTAAPEVAKPTGSRKSPGAAAAWSLIVGGLTPFDGAGQFYNGQIGKGFGFMGLSLLSTGVVVSGIEEGDDGTVIIGAIGRVASWILSSTDAYSSAKKINVERGWTTAIEPPDNSLYVGIAPESKGRGGMLAFSHRM